MKELDEMFQAPSETALPPIVRYCKSRREAGDTIEVELWRPEVTGGRSNLVIHRWKGEEEQELQQVEWDDGVNAELVSIGIRAIDLEHESARFAMGIRAALRKVERRFGDGYLNSVLMTLIDDSDLSRNGELADVRKHIHANPPHPGRSYDECRELIADEIGGRAVELRDKLGYGPEDVKAVMAKALAIYLDERFSVSSRRHFGLL